MNNIKDRHKVLQEQLYLVEIGLRSNKTRILELEDRIKRTRELNDDDEGRINGYLSRIEELKLSYKSYQVDSLIYTCKLTLMHIFIPLIWNEAWFKKWYI